MCNKFKNCKQHKNELYLCSKCKAYHLIFLVLADQVILTQKQINSIKNHLNKFYCCSVVRKNSNLACKENLLIIFNKNEFEIFKSLINNHSNRSRILTVDYTEYYLILCSD